MIEYHGTTTIGIICSDGIVLATEKRVTMGHFIASQDAKKVHQIDKTIGMTMAGSVGDAQRLIKWAKMETNSYKLQNDETITVKAISNILANILNNTKSNPYNVSLIVGGIDKTGAKLYSLDSIGGLVEELSFVSTGSGSSFAYSILEDQYKKNISINDGIKIAVRALSMSMKRDSASGGKINIVKINEKGYIELKETEINKILEVMK